MMTIRRADARGRADYGWLDSRHTFSFGSYYDPQHVGFRSLRVINEDRVQPGQGFGTHGHKDMEIISYVVEGALAHKDSMGNGSVLKAGQFQHITAGSGITHSEFNTSSEDSAHFYQIWIVPQDLGLTPSYTELMPNETESDDPWQLVASPDGEAGSMMIHQDVKLFTAAVASHAVLEYPLDPNRHAWVQIVDGEVEFNESTLRTGDGASLSEESELRLKAQTDAHVILFDLN